MLYSSDSGQTEPLAALVAVFALGIGLSLYVGVLDSTLPMLSTESEITPTAADKLVAESSSFGAIRPPIGGAVAASRPRGYELNATVRADETIWTGGPPRVGAADCLERSVSVRTAPGQVRPGILEVCVWPVQ
jgi:hypothetical protein